MKASLASIFLLPLFVFSQAQFTDVTSSKGFQVFDPANLYGSGVAAADYDQDGDIDLYVLCDGDNNNMLHRNLGDGTFELIQSEVSINMNSRAALWFDYNGDHLLDLLVAGDCYGQSGSCQDEDYIALFEQKQGGTFDNVTSQSGLLSGREVDGVFGGMAAGDIDNDGHLDLILDYWDGNVFLYKNTGKGSFEDVSSEMGVNLLSDYWQPLIFDITGNGWSDIYLTVDNDPNLFWSNNGDGTFSEIGEEVGLDNTHNDMGVSFGDYDNDNDLDIYITNIERDLPGKHNALFENRSSGTEISFTEVSKSVGVHSGGWGWGITFMDTNNDMFLDLAATNGPVATYGIDDKAKLWKNNGDRTFSDISLEARFNTNQDATSLISLDYDRDGDLDLIQTLKEDQGPVAVKLLENQLSTTPGFGNYLVVKPRMQGANHWGIGSKVSIKVGGETQSRAITAGISFYGQEPAEAFFGLGTNTTVDELTITWPGGAEITLANVSANQILTVEDQDALHSPGLLSIKTTEGLATELRWGHMSTNETLFLVERSESIDFTNADSFEVEAAEQSFSDEENLESGTFYYRVKASNGTEQSGFSNVVVREFNEVVAGSNSIGQVEVYPSPSTGSFQVQLPDDITANGKIQLLSVSGRLIDEFDLQKLKVSSNTVHLQTSADAGIYFLITILNDTRVSVSKISIVKN